MGKIMVDELLRKLKTGLEEEIRHYESMLKVSRDEQDVLKNETYSSKLISLASEKLRLMNEINRIGLMLSPLKVMWIKDRESNPDSPAENEIDPLINELSEVLERLLSVDRANTKKLAELTGTESVEEPLQVKDPLAAIKAYKDMSNK